MHQLASTLKRYLPYVLPIVSFVALVLLLNQTNPLDVGPAGILLVLGLVYVFISSTLYVLVTLILIILAYFVRIQVNSKRKIYYLTSIVAFLPVFLLALNSIGQLALKDFILVICFVTIACFYVVKRS